MEWRIIMNSKNVISMCIKCYRNKKCNEKKCEWNQECKIFHNIFHLYPYHIFDYNAKEVLSYLYQKIKEKENNE